MFWWWIRANNALGLPRICRFEIFPSETAKEFVNAHLFYLRKCCSGIKVISSSASLHLYCFYLMLCDVAKVLEFFHLCSPSHSAFSLLFPFFIPQFNLIYCIVYHHHVLLFFPVSFAFFTHLPGTQNVCYGSVLDKYVCCEKFTFNLTIIYTSFVRQIRKFMSCLFVCRFGFILLLHRYCPRHICRIF